VQAIAVFPKSRQVELITAAEPALETPTQVRLQMIDVGVCGTDREICTFEYGTPPAGSDHLIIGHESFAQVLEVGPAVNNLRAGDLVVPMVRRPCPHDHCTACRRERQDFCFTGDFSERGIKGAHGFMTERVVEEARYLNPVPRALREAAILVEPLTIAEKALIQLWHLQERLPWECPHRPGKDHGHCRRALVLGAGPVGLLGAMALRSRDFETIVYARDPAPRTKSELVAAIGATYVSANDIGPGEIAARFGAIDVVYEAAGASRVAFEAMAALGPNSIFVFTGVPGRKAPIDLDADLLMRNLVLNNQIVLGTVNAGRDAFEAAIRDVAEFGRRWPEALRSLVTARHAPTSFRELLLGRPTGIKNVISFGEVV
jgi:glucose 1-dehydrogenase